MIMSPEQTCRLNQTLWIYQNLQLYFRQTCVVSEEILCFQLIFFAILFCQFVFEMNDRPAQFFYELVRGMPVMERFLYQIFRDIPAIDQRIHSLQIKISHPDNKIT